MGRYFVKDGSMVGRKMAGEFILVPIRQNVANLQAMYSLNEVGSDIWTLLDTVHTTEELIDGLSVLYPVDKAELESDIKEFLSQLLEIGAIKETNAVEK